MIEAIIWWVDFRGQRAASEIPRDKGTNRQWGGGRGGGREGGRERDEEEMAQTRATLATNAGVANSPD